MLFISSMFEFISKGEGLRLCKLAVNSAMRKSHREPMNGLEIIQPSGTAFIGENSCTSLVYWI